MNKMRRFSAAMVLSGLVASGMIVSGTRVEAKGKGGGGGGTICSYLASVLEYERNSPTPSQTIIAYVTYLYNLYGCGQ